MPDKRDKKSGSHPAKQTPAERQDKIREKRDQANKPGLGRPGVQGFGGSGQQHDRSEEGRDTVADN